MALWLAVMSVATAITGVVHTTIVVVASTTRI